MVVAGDNIWKRADADEHSDTDVHAASSCGDMSLSVTPKDVEAHDASAQDMTVRQLQSADPEEKRQAMLDEAIDLTFPASDPLSLTAGVTRIETPAVPRPTIDTPTAGRPTINPTVSTIAKPCAEGDSRP